jgi:hypothetical protein
MPQRFLHRLAGEILDAAVEELAETGHAHPEYNYVLHFSSLSFLGMYLL